MDQAKNIQNPQKAATHPFILHIASEEMPARFVDGACAQLKRLFEKHLKAAGLAVEGVSNVQVFSTPRRLVLHAPHVLAARPPHTEEVKGPKTSAPEQAFQGFLKKTGQSPEDLSQKTIGKDTFWMAEIIWPEARAEGLLPGLVLSILQDFTWPQTMRWADTTFAWVRPLHGLFAAYAGQPLDITLSLGEGINLKSTPQVEGHRLASTWTDQGAFQPENFEELAQGLQKRGVILDGETRHRVVKEAVLRLAESLNAEAMDEDLAPGGLATEVAGLTSWPVMLKVPLDPAHQTLPLPVITEVLRQHMRCFVLRQKGAAGAVAPFFIFVADMPTAGRTQALEKGDSVVAFDGSSDNALCIKGVARVARARLEDARFFIESDQKVLLEKHLEGLKDRLLFKDLGTLFQKTQRLEQLAKVTLDMPDFSIGDTDAQAFKKAATLCKADLSSEMVQEMPSLQGIMGRTYGLGQGLPAAVCEAIADHYWPKGKSGLDAALPGPAGALLGIVDRMDSLYGFFALGLRPTGSKDPLALRRLGQGIAHLFLLLMRILPVPQHFCIIPMLRQMGDIYKSRDLLQKADHAAVFDAVLGFIVERLFFVMNEKGLPQPVIDWALGAGFYADKLFAQRMLHLKALYPWLVRDKSAKALEATAALRRLQGLKEQMRENLKNQNIQAPGAGTAPDPKLFENDKEAGLWQQAAALSEIDIQKAPEKFADAVWALGGPIDNFLASVMVITDDVNVLRNREVLFEAILANANSGAQWLALGSDGMDLPAECPF